MKNKKTKVSFLQFFKNLKYLTKLSLKKSILQNRLMDFSYEEIVENILYYIPNASVIRPQIYNADETLEFLKNSNDSLVRFGDGEIEVMNGNSILYQEYDEKLAEQLKAILTNNQANLMAAVPYKYFNPVYRSQENEFFKTFNLYMVPAYRKSFLKYMDLSKQYVDSGFAGMTRDQPFYDSIRQLWQDKKIITVGCQEADSAVQYDIFDNAKERVKILTPNKHAYREYERILQDIQKYDTSYMIILMCGPAAKVLTVDLAKQGYRALDLGHLAKGYDFFKRGIESTSEAAKKFFLPDEHEDDKKNGGSE